MAIWGKDCAVKVVAGKMVKSVTSPTGEESVLFKDILEEVKEMPEKELESVKGRYKGYEGRYIDDVDNKTQLALGLYATTTSKNFKEAYKGGFDKNGEAKFEEAKVYLIPEYGKKGTDTMNQLPSGEAKNTTPSKASDVTVAKCEEFVKRMGFDWKKLTDDLYDKNGNKVTQGASVDFFHKLVETVEGADKTQLPEESMHIAVRLIKEKDPQLFKEMMSRINKYSLYDDINAQYSKHPDYQIDGKPNIPKIKEEAIGKILVEHIIKSEDGATEKPELLQQTQTWWDKIKTFLKNIMGKQEWNPFKEAAEQFNRQEGTFSTDTGAEINQEDVKEEGISSYKEERDKMHQLPQEEKEGEEVANRLINENRVTSVIIPEKNINKYEIDYNGKKVEPMYRVTTMVKQFKDSLYNRGKTMQEEKKSGVEAELGTRGHAYIKDIMERYVDPTTGLRRETVLPKGNITPGEEEAYLKLEKYMKEKLDSLPKNTKYVWEKTIYLPGASGIPGKSDMVGTLDWLAITPEGYGYHLDWKFKVDHGNADTPDKMKMVHDRQMSYYAKMLKQGYGLKELKESNIVPFLFQFDKKAPLLRLTRDISPNLKKIDDYAELPLPSTQTTLFSNNNGISEVDVEATALFNSLNKELEIMRKKVPSGEGYVSAMEKIQRLDHAVRDLLFKKDVNGLILASRNNIKSYENSVKDIEKVLKDPDMAKNFTKQELDDKMADLVNAHYMLETYMGMDVALNKYLKDAPSGTQALKKQFRDINSLAENIRNKIYNEKTKTGLIPEVVKQIAEKKGIHNILNPELTIGQLEKLFTTYSSGRTKSVQLLYKVISPLKSQKDILTADNAKTLEELKEKAKKWMGGTWSKEKEKEFYQKIFRYRDGQFAPRLHSKMNAEFFSTLSKKQEEYYQGKEAKIDAKKWILDNIDVEEYKKDFEKTRSAYQKTVNESTYDLDDNKNKRIRQEKMDAFDARHDISKDTAFTMSNYMLRRHPVLGDAKNPPKNSWYSKEYLELHKKGNEPVLDFYHYAENIAKMAGEIGIIDKHNRTFAPQIRKDVVEAAMTGVSGKGILRNMLSGVINEPGEGLHIDPVTGNPKKEIHAAYTYDLGEEAEKDGNRYISYENASNDMFSVYSMFMGEMLNYKYMSEIEGLTKAMDLVEKNKATLIKHGGNLIKDESGKNITTEDNKTNYEYFKKEIDRALYGLKHGEDNVGFKFTFNGSEKYFSIPKALDKANRFYSLKVLGLNPATAASNLFGGSTNIFLRDNKFISKKDAAAGLAGVIENKLFKGEEGERFFHLLEHFVPFTESVERDLGRRMSSLEMRKWLSSDSLMSLMKNTDDFIQMGIAHAFFKNTMLDNGKLVNIREYVKQKNGFSSIYNLSEGERKAKFDKIEKEIEGLQKEKSLLTDKSISVKEDGRVEFKGLRPSPTEVDASEIVLRQQIQQLTRDVLGNRTPDEMAQINTTLFGSSLMAFKGWIPRLAEQRFGGLHYHAGSDTYEQGKILQLYSAISSNVDKKGKNLLNVLGYGLGLTGDSSIVEMAKADYRKKLLQERDKEGVYQNSMFELKMGEAEYVDQYVKGVKGAIRELAASVAMMGLFYVGLSYAMQQQKEKDKHIYGALASTKAMVKLLDKLSDELLFFYSLPSAKKLVTVSLPITSMVTDGLTLMKHGAQEIGFDLTGNEKEAEKNHVLKYIVDYTPVVNEVSDMFNIFSEDYHKWIGGVSPTTTYNPLGNR